MKILICGDVVGKAGRRAIDENLADLRRRLELDFVIVNGENAAHGFGITDKIWEAFYAAGPDGLTRRNPGVALPGRAGGSGWAGGNSGIFWFHRVGSPGADPNLTARRVTRSQLSDHSFS